MASSIRASKWALATTLLLLSGRSAWAQQNDPALAETLFRQGKALLEQGDYAHACPKLAESQSLDPGTGTLLALAICHEKEGKTASAWAEFTEVAAASKRDGRTDREKAARDKAASLEPRLSRLTIMVKDGGAVDVKRDGASIGRAAWGTAAPIDPGSHVIQASAAGKKPWSTTISVGPKADVRVEVPVLDDAPRPAPPPSSEAKSRPKPQEPMQGPNSRRTLGFVLGGVGLVALGAGSYFGIKALSENNQATSLCPGVCRNPEAVSLNSDARTHATVADVVIGAGIVALAIGGILVLTSSGSQEPAKTASFDRLRIRF
jgi:hypothetical protein